MKYYVSFHRVIMPKYGVLPLAQMEILWWVFDSEKGSQQPIEAGMALADWVSRSINPWSPIINTILHTFRMALLERTCSNIKTFHLWWSFHLFSWRVCLIRPVLLSREILYWSLLELQGLIHSLDGMLVHHRVVTIYSYTSVIRENNRNTESFAKEVFNSRK